MDREIKWAIGIVIVFIALILVLIGPKGCSRYVQSWKASSYGSDWLVVHYAQDGKVINHWELNDKSVGSEQNSDGIYFVDNQGNVVHLSGHYIYIQINSNQWEVAKERFLKKE